MCEGSRLFSSFSFWLDKRLLQCGDNSWSDFLHSIVLVVKAFQCQKMQLSHHRNMQQEQRSLTTCWMTWMVLHPFSSFTKHGLHAYTLPPPWWAHIDCQKMGRRLIRWQRRLKSLLRVSAGRNEWQIIHSTSSLLKWVAIIVLVLWHGSLATCSQVINTAGLCNDYTFCSGLQAQEIGLGSPDCFPHEKRGLGTRLDSPLLPIAFHFEHQTCTRCYSLT